MSAMLAVRLSVVGAVVFGTMGPPDPIGPVQQAGWTRLRHEGALLEVPPGAVDAPQSIRVQRLAAREVPKLSPGMINTTPEGRAFRFEPDGLTFRKAATLTLPFDPKRVPEGISTDEVRVFYFDVERDRWSAIQHLAVDDERHLCQSTTTHFTDYVTGVVVAPDSSEQVNFNPNQIKDIAVANPGAKINQIEPPVANSMGDANLSFPLELPPGRQGLQPSLNVQYTSAGGNGWLGLGWDLATPSITIDTTWGVPRYEGALETETYVMGGEQLTPLAHRGVLRARETEKTFHTRIEGAFRKIQRHGSNPRTYWWDVTEKDGTRYLYGGDDGGTIPEAQLTDASGNVFVWALREIRDTNDNFVRFHYSTVQDPGVPGSSVPGVMLYPDRITYTGSGNSEGTYSVRFLRDRQLGEPRRVDAMMDCRGGFKRVTADLLRRVEVSLDGRLIRSFDFQYRTGRFEKTLLRSISQRGADGSAFFTHTFDYFDPFEANSAGFATATSAPSDELHHVVHDDIIGSVSSSALGGTTTDSSQSHLYLAVGACSKELSAGFKVGTESSSSTENLTFLDIDGDGLPDQVHRSGRDFVFRRNLARTGRMGFEAPAPICDLPTLSLESSSTFTFGEQGFAFVASLIHDQSWTRTRGHAFLSDVNGDLRPDLVLGSSVLFNRIGSDGCPTFGLVSPTPLGPGATTNPSGMVTDPDAARDDIENAFHLVDPIRRWVAPYDGDLSIIGSVRLIDPAPDTYLTADGVKVALQYLGREQWFETILNPRDTAPRTFELRHFAVHRGQQLLFRANSRNDGAHDAVEFHPAITYENRDLTKTDENGFPFYSFDWTSDYAYGTPPLEWSAPFAGTGRLRGTLEKTGVTSDDIEVRIYRNKFLVHSQEISGSASGQFEIDAPFAFDAEDSVRFEVFSDSRIDIRKLHFLPQVAISPLITTIGSGSTPGHGAKTSLAGAEQQVIEAPLTTRIYPIEALDASYDPWTAPDGGEAIARLSIFPRLGVTSNINSDVALTIKSGGRLLGKVRAPIRNGLLVGATTLTIPATLVDKDTAWFFTATGSHPLTSDYFVFDGSITFQGLPFGSVDVGVHLGLPDSNAFGGGFRGWYYGEYNGNDALAPIDENLLRPPQAEDDQIVKQFVGMAPFLDEDHWRAQEPDSWISSMGMSPSRLVVKFLDFPDGTGFGGGRGITRYGGGDNEATSISGGVAGGGISNGSTWTDIDLLDFNGDAYPDVVGGGLLQPSLPSGGLDDRRMDIGQDASGRFFERVRESHSESTNLSIGGTTAKTLTNSGNKSPVIHTEQAAFEPSLLLSGGLFGADSDNDGRHDLVDINGDGLPDLVRASDTETTVRLNRGYGFLPPEIWPRMQGLQLEIGRSLGLSGGLGFATPSFSFGGGVTRTNSDSATEFDMIDINGDGLVDLVRKDVSKGVDGVSADQQAIEVRLNLGGAFTGPFSYSGALRQPLRDNNAVMTSVGGYFTISIPLFFFCIIINPGHYESDGISSHKSALMDFDGDGYADHIFSGSGGGIQVALNRHGPTNLLREVRRPLGGVLTLDYGRSGNTTEHPQNRWTLTSVAVFDGVHGDGPDFQAHAFEYEDGIYDRAERQFYGFTRVTDRAIDTTGVQSLDGLALHTLPLYRTTIRTYLNDSYYGRGLLTSELVTDGSGRPFTETRNTYEIVDVSDGAGQPGLGDFTRTRFPQLVRSDRLFYEGQPSPGKTTAMVYAYDEFGNVTQYLDLGDTGPEDDILSLIEYTGSDPVCRARNLVGIPRSVQVFGNGELMRRREADIDCTSGNMLQLRKYLGIGEVAQSDFSYFTNGNLRSVTSPPNLNGERFVLEFEFDSEVATHVTRVTDSFGYESSMDYDLRFGLPTRSTDINGQSILWTYDEFGRTRTIRGPYQAGTNQDTIVFQYEPDEPVPLARTQHIDVTSATGDPIETLLFIDGLGRELQTKKDASLHVDAGSAPAEAMIVSGRIMFDFVGRALERFHPTSEPKGSNDSFNPAFDSVRPTRTTYDVLDRVTSETIPDLTTTTWQYGFGPDRDGEQQFEQLITDANGVQRAHFTNVRDVTTAVREVHDGAFLWTSYQYDALDQLLEVKDDLGNRTLLGYDDLGRRTSIDNPDAGLVETVFDLSDNVVAKITPNLRPQQQAISYDYEFNRLVRIRYPQFPQNEVNYVYGGPGAARNRAGRIVRMSDHSGIEERAYGPLGEVVEEVKTVFVHNYRPVVPQPGTLPPFTYRSRYAYDTWNRLLRIVYPDSEVLVYAYDSGGLLSGARGNNNGVLYDYLRRLEYDRFGQRVFCETQNGIQTRYTYDPLDRRLAHLRCGPRSGTPFQNLSYSYDDVGNVLGLDNVVPVPRPNEFGGPVVQQFQYDDLYRLVHATGVHDYAPNKRDRYSLDLEYDSIHRMLRKEQRHELVKPSGHATPQHERTYTLEYAYDGPKPHAASHIGDKTYSHDANGNLDAWDHDRNGTRRSIVWNEEDRVEEIANNGHTITFKYTDRGERVIKRGPQGETVYINKYFTIRNGAIGTKHVFAATTRLATKVTPGFGSQDPAGGEAPPGTNFLFFYHPDHLGTSTYISDSDGELFQHRQYFPFGESWVEESSNTQWTPYLLASNEYDEETGLYYFGARYLDSKETNWISTDPQLPEYLSATEQERSELTHAPFARMYDSNIFGLYNYSNLNPIRYRDPDGRDADEFNVESALLTVADFAIGIGDEASFGLTGVVRQWMGTEGFVNKESTGYKAGVYTARAAALATAAVGITKYIGKQAVKEIAGETAARSASNALRLQKQLASKELLGELVEGGGRAIAGAGTSKPIRDIARLVKEYGGNAADWAKVSSGSRITKEGVRMEIHAYRNIATKELVEVKTKLPWIE